MGRAALSLHAVCREAGEFARLAKTHRQTFLNYKLSQTYEKVERITNTMYRPPYLRPKAIRTQKPCAPPWLRVAPCPEVTTGLSLAFPIPQTPPQFSCAPACAQIAYGSVLSVSRP